MKPSPPIQPLPENEFHQVPDPTTKIEVPVIVDIRPTTKPSRPVIKVPEPKVIAVAKPVAKPVQVPKVKIGHNLTSGVASYYCRPPTSRCTKGHPGGLYAAIRKDLLFLRGRTIKVTADNGKVVFVTIIDCNCGPSANLIDLYSDAFVKLRPISYGIVNVTISW